MTFPKDMPIELQQRLRLDEAIYGNAYYEKTTLIGSDAIEYERIDPMTVNVMYDEKGNCKKILINGEKHK